MEAGGVTVTGAPWWLGVEGQRSGRRRDAGLDHLAGPVVDFAGTQVAHAAVGQRGETAEADPAPAPVRHHHPRRLADDEKRVQPGQRPPGRVEFGTEDALPSAGRTVIVRSPSSRPGRTASVTAPGVSGHTSVTRPTGKRAPSRESISPRESSGVSGLVSQEATFSSLLARADNSGIRGFLSSRSTTGAAYVESSRARQRQRNHDRVNGRAPRRHIPPPATCRIRRARVRTGRWPAWVSRGAPKVIGRMPVPVPRHPTASM